MYFLYPMMDVGWIYGLRLTNSSTYRYIGQTRVDVDRRFKAHIATSKTERGAFPVHKWLRKYEDEIVVDVISTVPVSELDEAEIFWIKFFRSKYTSRPETLLNVEAGGSGFTIGFAGRHHTEETKAKIRERIGGQNSVHYGKPKSLAARQKLSEYKTGRPLSMETRMKMSESKLGRPSNARGSKRTKDFKNTMSSRMSGESNPYFGRTHSEETRQKMALGQHTKWHTNRGIAKKGCKLCNDTSNESS